MNLITGAAGHIGNVLVRTLIERGEQVRALILPGEDTRSLDGLAIERVEGNILDIESLKVAMQGVDVTFHLAGLVSITEDKSHLLEKVNVEGTRNVIEACKQAGVKKLIYTSSIHALERPPMGVPVNEDLTFDPENTAGPYDRTKAQASLLVQQAIHDGLDAVILCPTGVIGPHDYRRSELGELILSFMEQPVSFLVEGAYDFVDVRDVAQGHILARDIGEPGETYILGGERIELKFLHALVQKVTGKKAPVITFPLPIVLVLTPLIELYYKVTKTRPKVTRYALETVVSNSDIRSDKAKTKLGYSPRSLANSIADTVRWWWDNIRITKKSLRL